MDNRQQTIINFEGGKIRLIERSFNWRYPREYEAAPRMYVDVADETILDNLMNRRRRPYNEYKRMIRMSGLPTVIDLTKLSWSQKAGCSMCPCSPGFILNPQRVIAGELEFRRWDAWVTLEGAPAVDEAKAPRVLELV